jgi:transposase
MKTTRKRYSAAFKAKVALEAIRGDLTLAELAAKHGVHHTMIAAWKRQAIDGMAGTFSGAGDAARAVSDNEVEKLHAKIGQLECWAPPASSTTSIMMVTVGRWASTPPRAIS